MNLTKIIRSTSIMFSLLIIGLTPAFASTTQEVNISPLDEVIVATKHFDGDRLVVHVRFNDSSGKPLDHVNYDISAWYKSKLILDDSGVHQHYGIAEHITSPINYVYSTEDTVDIKIVLQGIGLSDPYEGPVGKILTFSEWLRPPTTLPTNNDNTPPMILGSKNIVIDYSGSDGTIVDYSIKAIDDIDELISHECNPTSGSKFPVGITTVKCFATDNASNYAEIEFIVTVKGSSASIPIWIKNVAGFWCNDEINDTGFVEGIQYLIKNNVIVIPISDTVPGSTSKVIPAWIKNNACWWSAGNIEDDDFTRGLQFLVKHGIIRI